MADSPILFIHVSYPPKRPDLQELVRKHWNLSWDKVKQVLLHLGVPKHRIDDIEAIYPTYDESRRMSAWDCWLQMDVRASWSKVAHALEACDVKFMGKYSKTFGVTTPEPVPTSFVVPTLTDKPTLAQLQKLKVPKYQDICIIDQVAGRWEYIAIAMDFNPIGHTQTAINKDFSTVQEKCTEMFKKWLQGLGSKQPATWEMLVEILKDCDFKLLATSIETVLS